MDLIINKNTKIISSWETTPVQTAIHNLQRDIDKVCTPTTKNGADIYLVPNKIQEECFRVKSEDGCLKIMAGDDLGFIYGIYGVSRMILGIEDFWFWNDQQFKQRKQFIISEEYEYVSKPFEVKYRGWFINDETLIMGWSVDRSKEKPWEMVFEALLRCGGNMTIPGTGINAKDYHKMASDMGLYITHHHAEPLGAEMFIHAYPDLTPSYAEYADKFHKLWKEAILKQKDSKVLWNLGFRGQGDCPFWETDPNYNTTESRGRLMSDIIKMQYDMVKEELPDAVCCTNLYGETMELYREGQLQLPEDVIKIWADNGYGKMVTRRQGNHNPRVYSLPEASDKGCHGIYYHVSFYDLQAANHITMLPNSPEFINAQLKEAMEHNAKDYWIINCSNVKPHVYYLDMIAKMWHNREINIKLHRNEYVARYYGEENTKLVSECLKQYFEYALPYGEHEDDHAGEQFANHIARILISQYMKDETKSAKELSWATDAETFRDQVQWYEELCRTAVTGYDEYVNECERVLTELIGPGKLLFKDSILLQAQIYDYCFKGAVYACESIRMAMDGNYKEAFYKAGKGKREYIAGNRAMRDKEHGKWHNFYENECQVDVKQTAWLLGGLMSYIRNLGEGPHFYEWQRELQDTKEDQRVMLLLNTKNHLQDEELFTLMEEKWDA